MATSKRPAGPKVKAIAEDIVADLRGGPQGEELDVLARITETWGEPASLLDAVVAEVYRLCPEAEETAHGGSAVFIPRDDDETGAEDGNVPTLAEIRKDFGCTYAVAQRIQAVARAGYEHGLDGFYPDGEYGSDADWCYGTGTEIRSLEALLKIDDGTVFDLYRDHHAAGLEDEGAEGDVDVDSEDWPEDECPDQDDA